MGTPGDRRDADSKGAAIASFGKYTQAARRYALGLVGLGVGVLCVALCLVIGYQVRQVEARDVATRFHLPTLAALSQVGRDAALLEAGGVAAVGAPERIAAALSEIRRLQARFGSTGDAPTVDRLDERWRALSPPGGVGLVIPAARARLEGFRAALDELALRHEAAVRRLTAGDASIRWNWAMTLGLPLALVLGVGAVGGYGLFRRLSRATLRQQALERSLRRAEAEHARAQAMARLGHWSWDIASNRVTRSPETYWIFGQTPEAMGPSTDAFFELVHPEDRVRLRKQVAEALAHGGPFSAEYRIVRPDGAVRVIDSRAEVRRDPATGRAVRMDGTVQDLTERTAMEASLRTNEALLRQLTETIDQVFWVRDAETGILHYLSPAYEAIWGRSRESARRDPAAWMDAIHADDLPRVRRALEAARAEGRPYEVTYRIVRPDGEERVILGRGFPVRDGAGRVFRWAGVSADVTELSRLQGALKESEERLRQVTETIREVFWVGLPDGGPVLYVSAAYESIWGRSRESLYRDPHSWLEALHPEDRPRMVEALARQTEGETEETFRIVRPDGEVRWIRNRSYPVRDASGRVYRLAGSAADVTEQKRAEASLRAQEERTRLILDSTAEGIYEVDLEGRCTFANAACVRLLGYERPEDLLGRDMHEALQHRHADGRAYPTSACEVHHAMREGRHFHRVDGYVLRADGSSLAVDFWAHPVYRDGVLAGGVMTFVDATERRQAEAERSRYQEELAHVTRLSTMGEMASGLAHEINQPLAAIANFAQGSLKRLRQQPGRTDRGVLESLEQISIQAGRAGGIIRHLREFVGKGQGRRLPADLNTLVTSAARLIEPEARRHAVDLRLELGEDLPPVVVDRIQLDQVLINLMKNGVEALAEAAAPRRLTLKTGRGRNGALEVTVADNGPGLAAVDAERLFHPFFTTKAEGLGMGLAISRSIIQAHGGELVAVDGTTGGAAFRFTVPVEAAADA